MYSSRHLRTADTIHYAFSHSLKPDVWFVGHGACRGDHGVNNPGHETGKPRSRHGTFFTTYFLVQAPAPAIAGWLYDLTTDELWPILFAGTLFLFTAIANLAFRFAQKRWPI